MRYARLVACARSNKSWFWRMYVLFYCFKDSIFHSKISSHVTSAYRHPFTFYNENKVPRYKHYSYKIFCTIAAPDMTIIPLTFDIFWVCERAYCFSSVVPHGGNTYWMTIAISFINVCLCSSYFVALINGLDIRFKFITCYRTTYKLDTTIHYMTKYAKFDRELWNEISFIVEMIITIIERLFCNVLYRPETNIVSDTDCIKTIQCYFLFYERSTKGIINEKEIVALN